MCYVAVSLRAGAWLWRRASGRGEGLLQEVGAAHMAQLLPWLLQWRQRAQQGAVPNSVATSGMPTVGGSLSPAVNA